VRTGLPAVILIEMDDVTLDLYRRELSKAFEVLTFTQIDGVLEALADRDVRAVVIEPEVDSGAGWELIRSLRAPFPGRSVPVIVCSTREPRRTEADGEVAKYLTKPVLPKTLLEKILEVTKNGK